MSTYTGRQINFGIGTEASRGTKATNIMWIPKTNLDFDDKIEVSENEASLGDKIDISGIELTKQWGEGTVETKASANAIGYFLTYALGSCTTTAVDTHYMHNIKIKNDGPNPSASIFISEPNGNYYYPLGLISEFTLSASVGEPITTTAGFTSKKAVSDNTLAPDYIEDYTFTTKNATIKIAETVADLDTAPLACIESVELQIQKENIEQYCLNYGDEPKDIVDGKISITGSLVATFSDTDYKNLALDGKQFAFKIELEDEGAYNTLGFYPSLSITIPKAKFTDYGRDKGNDDIVKVNLSFKAFKNDNTEAIDVVLINNKESYLN